MTWHMLVHISPSIAEFRYPVICTYSDILNRQNSTSAAGCLGLHSDRVTVGKSEHGNLLGWRSVEQTQKCRAHVIFWTGRLLVVCMPDSCIDND